MKYISNTIATALLAALAVLPVKKVKADVAVCFVQSAAGVITPCTSDAAGNLITSSSPLASSATDGSGTITTGGTFQTVAAASTTRKNLEFTNICNTTGNCTATTNMCYVFIAVSGTPTTANSIPVPPGTQYIRTDGSIPTNAIQATCAGNSDKFALKTQ